MTTPIILSKNEKLIAQMSELEKDDMLDVRGVLTTREVLKFHDLSQLRRKKQR